nr:alginate lyase family protein [uncultured Allomuricauda sp.]
MNRKTYHFFCLLFVFCFHTLIQAQEHPKLILTKQGVEAIRSKLGTVPLFDASLSKIKDEVDAEIATGIHMPIPKDYSGGYTHERHKKNFLILQKAGVLFQILDDEKYAVYVRDVLMSYAEMYPTLPVHPKERSYARGKLFWQCLNDSNWLVYTSQAYDCIYDWLSKNERKKLEKDLFKPFADFISKGNPQFFNRVHNHSTWGNVAVGMIALVMDDDQLLNRALYGLKVDNLSEDMKDNDGGFIKTKDQKIGFFGNLDEPFSPDGYYTEGPYYQRYAMYPFLIFGQALHNAKPELKIFEYNDGVLLKSVETLLNLTDANGEFFPINDGQKGMSYYSRELVTAVDIAYHFGGENAQLLSIAEKQDRVVLNDAGLSIAIGIKEGKSEPFLKKTVNLLDGSDGTEGGIGILRKNDMELVFKYAAQGLSHGHYDKLSFSVFEKGDEVLQDYGLARFVNIEQKGGGNYLKENTTWAKQTIAHNTLVQNETSHFQGKYEIGSKNHSVLHFFDASDKNLQLISAKEKNAYPGTELHRTFALITDSDYEKPYILDILKVSSETSNQYDLPFYFLGQVMEVNFDYEAPKTLGQIGAANGYQHLWLEGKGQPKSKNTKLSWLNNQKFYSLTVAANLQDELLFARIGANDPSFNLRRDPALIVRRKDISNTVFVSIIESHGSYSPVSEFAVNASSSVAALQVVIDTMDFTAVEIESEKGNTKLLIVSNVNTLKEQKHELEIENNIYNWTGPYYFGQLKK